MLRGLTMPCQSCCKIQQLYSSVNVMDIAPVHLLHLQAALSACVSCRPPDSDAESQATS